MSDITFVIPIAPYHDAIVQHAIWSAKAQTIPCEVVTVKDTDQRGAGWARNTGLAQVSTDFTIFLDADDIVDRTFAEKCLNAWVAGKYVYTDWWQGDKRIAAPNCAWVDRTWHTVTTLIPTAYVRTVGGFDEKLSGGEDTDFYLKLASRGYCGKRLPEALFHYSLDGRRGHAFVHGEDKDAILRSFTDKYGGVKMSCCGGGTPNVGSDAPVGVQQQGDVLATAQWGGNRQVIGAATGRMYPRTSRTDPPTMIWVDPRDVGASPHLWRVMEPEIEIEHPNGLDVIAGHFRRLAPYEPAAVQPAQRANTQPDFNRLTEAFEPNSPISLTAQEFKALREGHTVEVTDDSVKINRRHKPDIVTTQPRKRRSDSGTKRPRK